MGALNSHTNPEGKTILPNAVAGHAKRPTELQLAVVSGPTDALWHGLIAELKRDLTLDAEEWNSSSVKAGWLLRLQRKQRNIVYLGPHGMVPGFFRVGR